LSASDSDGDNFGDVNGEDNSMQPVPNVVDSVPVDNEEEETIQQGDDIANENGLDNMFWSLNLH
jgi:hypothetical protein